MPHFVALKFACTRHALSCVFYSAATLSLLLDIFQSKLSNDSSIFINILYLYKYKAISFLETLLISCSIFSQFLDSKPKFFLGFAWLVSAIFVLEVGRPFVVCICFVVCNFNFVLGGLFSFCLLIWVLFYFIFCYMGFNLIGNVLFGLKESGEILEKYNSCCFGFSKIFRYFSCVFSLKQLTRQSIKFIL